ncbi:MAG: hypothetical protein LBI61_00185 [Puniceicoccales bacterium]|jgi:hypothetical protein|nr:hypothetical protein [Puniceicoccales bacterium]
MCLSRIFDLLFGRPFSFSPVSKKLNKKASKDLKEALGCGGTFQVYKTPGDGNCMLWAWQQCQWLGENKIPTAGEYAKFLDEGVPHLRGLIADYARTNFTASENIVKRIANPGLFSRRIDPNYAVAPLAKEAGKPVVSVYNNGVGFATAISDPDRQSDWCSEFNDVKDKKPIIIYCTGRHARAVKYTPDNGAS